MATLTNQTIASSYEQLLSLPNGGGDTTNLVAITDGDAGTTFCLQLATTKAMIEGSGSKLFFSDEGGEHISGNGSVLSIAGGSEIDLASAAIDINATGAVTIDSADDSNLTVTGSNKDLAISVAGGSTQTLTISSAGTGTNAIDINATGGGVDIDANGAISLDSAAGSIDINVVDGQTVKLGLNGAVEQIIAPHGTAGSELYSLINTAGTTDGADAAGAILLSSVAGGIGLAWADDKDLWAEGGRAVITANEDAADAIKLHADAGASQTITIVNDAGTGAAAIGLTASAGGVTVGLGGGAGDDFIVDTTTLVVESDNNRVGIGTAAPEDALHVKDATDVWGPVLTIENSYDSDKMGALHMVNSRATAAANDYVFLQYGLADNNADEETEYITMAGQIVDVTNGSEDSKLNIGVMSAGTVKYMTLQSGNVGIGDSDPSEAKLSITGVESGDYGIKIDQDQAQPGLFISQDGNSNAINIDTASTGSAALEVEAPATTDGTVLMVYSADALTTGGLLYLETGSTNLATTAAGGVVEIISTGNTSSNANNLLFIKNDDASSSGTTCLLIDQDANNYGMFIGHDGTTQNALQIEANALTTGGCAQFYSDSSDSHSSRARSVVKIVNDNAATDYAVGLHVQQDGNGAAIELSGAGNCGIKFPATVGPSSDANTLDDYEEGTFTPAFTASTCSWNIDSANGYYQKVGNTVHFSFWLKTTGISSGTESNGLSITGLPFTSNNSTNYYGSVSMNYAVGFDANVGEGDFLGWRIEGNVTRIDPIVSNDDAASSALTAAAANSSDCRLIIGGHYRV